MIRLTEPFQVQRRRHLYPQRALDLFDSCQQRHSPYDYKVHSRVAILEEGDDIGRVPRELGRYGLLEILDNPWRCYDTISTFTEGGTRYFEMVITLQPGITLTLLIPDKLWLDSRLRLVLEVETEPEPSNDHPSTGVAP